MISEAIDETQRILPTINAIALAKSCFIGGSLCRGFHDQYSDIDVCIITQSAQDADEIARANQQYGTHKSATGWNWRIPSVRYNYLDIRCINILYINALVEKIMSNHELSASSLDTLSVLKHGIYLFDKLALKDRLHDINLTPDAQKIIIKNNSKFIVDYGFKKMVARGDWPQYFECLGIIYRAYIHILYATNNVVFLGYRHKHQRINALENIHLDIEALFDNAYTTPCDLRVTQLIAAIHRHYIHEPSMVIA